MGSKGPGIGPFQKENLEHKGQTNEQFARTKKDKHHFHGTILQPNARITTITPQ